MFFAAGISLEKPGMATNNISNTGINFLTSFMMLGFMILNPFIKCNAVRVFGESKRNQGFLSG
jgi:hypothetical protein